VKAIEEKEKKRVNLEKVSLILLSFGLTEFFNFARG
jgi:hypothetical protein